MRNRNPLLLLGILIAVLLLVSYGSQYLNHPPMPKSTKTEEEQHEDEHVQIIGRQALDFQLPTLDYKNVRISRYKGKNSILMFFVSTKQTTSVQYINILKKMEEKYAGQGLKSIAIFMLSARPDVTKFAQKNNINIPVALDPNGTISMQYLQVAMASSFLIDKNGNIYSTFSRPDPKDLEADVDSSIQSMLEGKPAPKVVHGKVVQ